MKKEIIQQVFTGIRIIINPLQPFHKDYGAETYGSNFRGDIKNHLNNFSILFGCFGGNCMT